MKFLFLLLLLVGCGSGEKKAETPDIVLPEYVEVAVPELRHNDSINYNGQIDYINDNSWVYTSHTNPNCSYSQAGDRALRSMCRKVNSLFIDELASDRSIKIEFKFTLNEYNVYDSPYWVILYQDWVRIDPEDENGNHPISTLKIKNFNGKIYLAHYDNSWQWDYVHPENDKWDALHNHDENTLNGFAEIEVGVEYNVEIITHDSGVFVFKLNDRLISKRLYQTKSLASGHAIQWGQYWDKGYNKENNPYNRVILSIDDFKMYSAIK